jgi:hypothetical protein
MYVLSLHGYNIFTPVQERRHRRRRACFAHYATAGVAHRNQARGGAGQSRVVAPERAAEGNQPFAGGIWADYLSVRQTAVRRV